MTSRWKSLTKIQMTLTNWLKKKLKTESYWQKKNQMSLPRMRLNFENY